MTISFLRRFLLLLCCLSLAACGFHLRGPQPLPFSTIYLDPSSALNGPITKQIALSGSTTVVGDPAQAEVRLIVIRDAKDKVIQAISGSGTVNEYELRQRFAFRLINKQGLEVMPFNEIYAYRTMTFAPGLELSKEQEEALLFADIQKDIVQQLVRRLASAKL